MKGFSDNLNWCVSESGPADKREWLFSKTGVDCQSNICVTSCYCVCCFSKEACSVIWCCWHYVMLFLLHNLKCTIEFSVQKKEILQSFINSGFIHFFGTSAQYYVTAFVIIVSLMYYRYWFYPPAITVTSWYWFPVWLPRKTESCFPERFDDKPVRQPLWALYGQGRIRLFYCEVPKRFFKDGFLTRFS